MTWIYPSPTTSTSVGDQSWKRSSAIEDKESSDDKDSKKHSAVQALQK